MGHRTTKRRKGVVFGAGMLGGIMAFSSLAFACTPIVGMMTITNVDSNSLHYETQSVAVGMGRARIVGTAAMDFCEDNWLTPAPLDGVKGGATADHGELIRIDLAPAVCDENILLSNVTNLAQKINNEVQNGNLDPRNWPFLFEIEAANFLFPDPAAEVNYHPSSFNSSYTYQEGNDCMNWNGTDVNNSGAVVGGVNTGVPFGNMPVGPGTGSATFPIPDDTVLPGGVPSEGWNESVGSGGVCVDAYLGGVVGPTRAISMAPLTVI